MDCCKDCCLIEDCGRAPSCFTNFCRFHKICEEHLGMSKEYQEWKCRVCENMVKVVKNSQLCLNKDGGMAGPDSMSGGFEIKQCRPEMYSNCNEPVYVQGQDYFERSQRVMCSEHKFNPQFLSNEYAYCPSCFCFYCRVQGAYLKQNCYNSCETCYRKYKCVYCNAIGSSRFQECDHYYCTNHYYPEFLCMCFTCNNCHSFKVQRKSCFHAHQCQCPFKNLCTECVQKEISDLDIISGKNSKNEDDCGFELL